MATEAQTATDGQTVDGRVGTDPAGRPDPTESFTCMTCGKQLKTEQGVRIHVARVHGPNRIGQGRKKRAAPPTPTPAQDDVSVAYESAIAVVTEATEAIAAYRQGTAKLCEANKSLRLELIKSRHEAHKLRKVLLKEAP